MAINLLRQKDYFLPILGNYTDESIQRVAKAVDVSKLLRSTLSPQYTERLVRGGW